MVAETPPKIMGQYWCVKIAIILDSMILPNENATVTSAGGFIFFEDIVTKETFVLLIKNPKSEYWIPKGKLEIGEDQKTAALREIKEETGLGPNKVSYIDFCHLDNYVYEESGRIISKELYINVFEAKQKFPPAPEDWNNIEEVSWYRYEDAKELISFNREQLVDSYQIFQERKEHE